MLVEVLPQRAIDQRLIISTSLLFHLLAKPLDNILINPNSDPCFSSGWSNDRATRACRKIVLVLHCVSRHDGFLPDTSVVLGGLPVVRK